MKNRLFFGTGNLNKVREIDTALSGRYKIVSFQDIGTLEEVEETGQTLAENAILKAKAYFNAVKMPSFADDTGLEVEALNGAPGIFSARYAGEEKSSDKNMDKLLSELNSQANRAAQFRTVIALYDGSELRTFEGILRGSIAFEKSGSFGFGYDPIFIPEGEERSLAAFSIKEKNKISHRGKAIRKLVEFLNNESI